MSASVTEYGKTVIEKLTETGEIVNGSITEVGELILNALEPMVEPKTQLFLILGDLAIQLTGNQILKSPFTLIF